MLYDYASYYSYDVHGNVKILVHDDQMFRTMFGAVEITKKIDYLYNLVSGRNPSLCLSPEKGEKNTEL